MRSARAAWSGVKGSRDMRALRERMTTRSGWTHRRAPLYEISHPLSRRLPAIVAWAILLPTLAVSCGMLVSQGERGFLGLSQAVSTGSLFLTLSFGVGYGASRIFHPKPPAK